MTHADVQRWLDRCVEAWETYGEAEIADLFSGSLARASNLPT